MWTRKDSHLEARSSTVPSSHPMTEAHPGTRGEAGSALGLETGPERRPVYALSEPLPLLLQDQASETKPSSFIFSSGASPQPQRREGCMEPSHSLLFLRASPPSTAGTLCLISGNGGIWRVPTEERRACGHGPSPAALTWGWLAAPVRVRSVVSSQGLGSCSQAPQLPPTCRTGPASASAHCWTRGGLGRLRAGRGVLWHK